MRSPDLLLGIDVGTSRLKASVFDRSGNLLAQASRPSGYLPLPDGEREQDPEQWWQNLCEVLAEILGRPDIAPQRISGIGICGFHHCPVFLKADGRPARPVILLHDPRLAASRQELAQSGVLAEIEQLTRSMVSAGHFPPIFHYVSGHQPRRLAEVRWILLAKDYLRFRLTGRIGTEICDATGTNLIEPGQNGWSDRLCGLLGVPAEALPPIGGPAGIAGHVTAAAGMETGLSTGTLVVHGGGDSHCALLGLGCVEDGDTGLLLGTNSTLRTVFSQFVSHPRISLWVQHHVAPDRYTVSASSMAGASVLNWFRQRFCPQSEGDGEAFRQMELLAEQLPAGSDGLTFLPYIHGERCPFYDPDASGAFAGIRHHHGAEHFLRSVLEGVAVNIADCLDLIGQCAAPRATRIDSLRLAGGGSGMGLWHQIISDCLDLPIHVMSTQEAGTLGAALLAGIGTGLYAGYDEAISAAVRIERTIEPIAGNVAAYHALRLRFTDLREGMQSCTASCCKIESP